MNNVLLPVTPNEPQEKKDALREKIKRDIDEFMRAGNKLKKVNQGVVAVSANDFKPKMIDNRNWHATRIDIRRK